jgi:SAM-dependent methyltransferase
VLTDDLLGFVRSALPAAPARVLEVGAGEGELAEVLRGLGYEVRAIDPASETPEVEAVALHELAAPAGSFDAAVAIVSLHHVEPLQESCARLAELVRPGGRLVIDEFDVERYDVRAATWWSLQKAAIGNPPDRSPADLVEHYRGHLHTLVSIAAALDGGFALGDPVRCAYLYRWYVGEGLRGAEERLIAEGALPATGARLVGIRRD